MVSSEVSAEQPISKPARVVNLIGLKDSRVRKGEEGWVRDQENIAEPSLKAQTGWSFRNHLSRMTTPSTPLLTIW